MAFKIACFCPAWKFSPPPGPPLVVTISSPNHHRSNSAVVGVTFSRMSAAPDSRPRQSWRVLVVRAEERASGLSVSVMGKQGWQIKQAWENSTDV